MTKPQHMYGKGRAIIARTILCVFAVASILPAQAQPAQLRDQVQLAQSDLDAAVAAHPSYQAVVNAIGTDCAGKLPDDAKMDGFCRCAAAVTFALWRSRVDGGDMLDRLNLYLSNPTAAEVADLLHYADTGMYKSACEHVLGKS